MVSPSDHKKRIINETEGRYMAVDIVPPLITREIFEAVAAERERRSNITKDDDGSRRKSTHYSSKRSAAYVGRGGKEQEDTTDRSTKLLPSEE